RTCSRCSSGRFVTPATGSSTTASCRSRPTATRHDSSTTAATTSARFTESRLDRQHRPGGAAATAARPHYRIQGALPMSKLIPAVGYLRRSTDGQEASIPDQTKAIQKYAADNGYSIIRWYIDDAISGDDTRKRRDFLRMIDDAQTKGDFKAIICWDGKRFGRFDSIEY